jgi:hypothetical protein
MLLVTAVFVLLPLVLHHYVGKFTFQLRRALVDFCFNFRITVSSRLLTKKINCVVHWLRLLAKKISSVEIVCQPD